MKLIIIAFLILPLVVHAQGLVLSGDSTSVSFPNQVKLSLTKNTINGRTYFQLESKAFKAFVLTTDHYVKQNSVSVNNVEILLKNQSLSDSSYQLMQKKLDIEKDRTLLYKNAFEDLKEISSGYDRQLIKCTNDLADLKKEKDKSRNVSFIKGFLWGAGLLGGIFAIGSISN